MKASTRNYLIFFLLVFPVVLISLTYLEDVAERTGGGSGEGMFSFVGALTRQIIDVASEAGYAGIFVLMLLEAAAFPVPSEMILPFAGYLVYQRTLEFWPIIFYTTLAALIGSFIDYYLGSILGSRLLTEPSKIPFVSSEHLQKAHLWFQRYGGVAVAAFRLVPAARVLISFPAGLYRMSRWKFAVYTVAGCLPWNIILVYLGWWLGSSWDAIVEAFRYINLVVYAFLVLLVIWIGWRLTSSRKSSAQRV